MGKEIICDRNDLEFLCDLMCGEPEEDIDEIGDNDYGMELSESYGE